MKYIGVILFLAFSCMASEEFTNPRDGEKYIIREMSDGSVWFMQDLGGEGKGFNWRQASGRETCPGGWHLPNNKEWKALNELAKNDGKLIEEFTRSGASNHWWSSSEYSIHYSWLWYTSGDHFDSIYSDKMENYPIRCIKDKLDKR